MRNNLGLGVMGATDGAASRRGGARTSGVYNRNGGEGRGLCREPMGTVRRGTPREPAEGAEIVFALRGHDDECWRAICSREDGALPRPWPRARSSSITRTSVAHVTRDLAEAARPGGIGYVRRAGLGRAGPVAENGQLGLMCGGSEQAVSTRAEPVIRGHKCKGSAGLMGSPSGDRQLTKMVKPDLHRGAARGSLGGAQFAEKAEAERARR